MKQNQLENFTMDIIKFLKKWGLWTDCVILTNGNMYQYSYEKNKSYKGISNVEFTENVNPENYTTGITGNADCEGNVTYKNYANPEHIWDMVIDSNLYCLLNYREYEVKKSDISAKAWEAIFKYSDILEEIIFDKYGCSDVSDLMDIILNGSIETPDYPVWNPLIFDTWKEYQEFVQENQEDIKCNDLGNITIYDVRDTWEQMVNDAKEEYIAKAAYERELIYLPQIAAHIISEFDKIFEHYGLSYDYGSSWAISCYNLNKYQNYNTVVDIL